MDGRTLTAPAARARTITTRLLPVLATVAVALAIILGLIALTGRDPGRAVLVFFGESLGRADGIYEILVRAIPLTLVGLGIAVAFRARIFNVGADGQLIVGALLAVAVAQALPGLPGWLLVPLFLVAGAVGGGVYGGIAGWMRARYNANEIIVTIMLTYVAIQLLSWAIRGPMQESMGIFPRSDPIPEAASFGLLIAGSRVHAGLLVALAAAALLAFVLARTRFGFQLDAVGASRSAARYGGTHDGRVIVGSMLASGAFAGLAGAVEIAGIHGRLQDGFATGVGITAIEVALLARLNPWFVPLTAGLFGLLTVGSSALQRELGIPFPLVSVIEGVVIFGFLMMTWLRARRRAREAVA